MKTIWKFEIDADERQQTIEMPRGAMVMHVETQAGTPRMWAMVESGLESEERVFEVVGTGWQFDPAGRDYVGTFLLHGGALVFHVFEVRR